MKVKVRIFGDLTSILDRGQTIEMEEGANVRTLTRRLSEQAGIRRYGYLGRYKLDGSELAILVNGRNIALLDGVETALEDGDEVVLLPPSAGG